MTGRVPSAPDTYFARGRTYVIQPKDIVCLLTGMLLEARSFAENSAQRPFAYIGKSTPRGYSKVLH